MPNAAADQLLGAYVEAHNAGVRSGDFRQLVELFADDAMLRFEGIDLGPFVGRGEIAAAFSERPPDDQLILLDHQSSEREATGEVRWKRAGDRAGTVQIGIAKGKIADLIIRVA